MSIRNYDVVRSIEELADLVHRLIDEGLPIAFDLETGYHGPDREKFAVHPETAIVVGFSFTNSTDWARYVPLAHDVGENLDNTLAAALLWELLSTGLGVAHNADFELRHLAKLFRALLWDHPEHGEAVRASAGYFPIRSDTMVEAYLSADFPAFGLKYLTTVMFDRTGKAQREQWPDRIRRWAAVKAIKDPDERQAAEAAFDGHKMTELHELFPDLAKNKRKFLRFNVLELTPQVIEYACEDSVWCLAIHLCYGEQVADTLLGKVEKAIVQDVLHGMEDEGVLYDWAGMRRNADKLRAFRDKYNAEIMTELSELAGEPIAVNLASPPQISDVLFNKLGYATTVYTDKTRDLPPSQRKMSTGKIALERLAQQYPVVQKIREWKQMTRLMGTYLEKYEGLYNYADDGRAHPSYLSAFVVTGRFAVADPPIQQSPKIYHYDLLPAREAHAAHKEAHGKDCKCEEFPPPAGTCFKFNFRDMIIAPPDHYGLGFDLSQAELRAIAGEARETALLEAFENGDDVHVLTASLMLGIPLEEVTKDQRGVGKTMNFALLYGMGVKSLADRLGLPIEEAQSLMDKYFAGYPGIAAWSAKQVRFGKEFGYVSSKFGRKLPIWEYQDDRRWIQQKGDRACVNYPIQGAATGDYMKIAMVRAVAAIKGAGLSDKIKMVMNIHDALEFYVHSSLEPHDVIALLKPAVVFPVPGWPRMQADWHVFRKWGSPTELDVRDDGTIYAGGDKIYDPAPAIIEDEDGDEVYVMPEVDREVLAEAARTPPRHVTITLTEMPTRAAWINFQDLVTSVPGANTVRVITPEGELELASRSGIRLDDLGRVSALLGDVSMRFDAASEDTKGVAAGLAL